MENQTEIIQPAAFDFSAALRAMIDAPPLSTDLTRPRSEQIADIQRLEGELALAREAVRRFDHRLDLAKRVLSQSIQRADVEARHLPSTAPFEFRAMPRGFQSSGFQNPGFQGGDAAPAAPAETTTGASWVPGYDRHWRRVRAELDKQKERDKQLWERIEQDLKGEEDDIEVLMLTLLTL